ncbi:MAG: hypothetical protein A3J29_07990 [Acidobacteria bacterium RIFCSPLOWO2_12_FULL_67_14b]|nr:MAG: hypothetical protein A3J29_07990 [Acidobacteria bacterium RIFCSPLOWO2_12_FULL_67_14b]
MTLFQHMLLQARSGLSDIDCDRDRALSFMARYGGSPALDAWLGTLEVERAQHLLILDGLDELRRQQHPALLHEVRATRMAKAALRAAPAAIRTGTDQ